MYNPEKSQPQAYCTAGRGDGPKAVEWLAKCANDSWDGSYNIRLVTLAGERLDAETQQKLNKRALHWYKKSDKRNGKTVGEMRD